LKKKTVWCTVPVESTENIFGYFPQCVFPQWILSNHWKTILCSNTTVL